MSTDTPTCTAEEGIQRCVWPDGVAFVTCPEVRDLKDARKYLFTAELHHQLVTEAILNPDNLHERQAFRAECLHLDGQVPDQWLARLLHAAQHHRERRSSAARATKTLTATQLSNVQPERVAYLWKPFLHRGRPCALEGDPGIGKSLLVAKIIAHVTTGKPFPNVLPNHPPLPAFAPGNVCLFAGEDDAGDTLVPRLAVNGADLQRVYLIEGWRQSDGEQGVVTLQDLTLVQQALDVYAPVLMVFDPLQAFLGRGVDMNDATKTRPVLDAIAALCKPSGCTTLYVRHIGKSHKEKALYAGLGSIDIAGRMRSVLFVGADPQDPERRIVAQSKINAGPRGQSLAYRITEAVEDIAAPDGTVVTIEAAQALWDGLSPLTADDLVAVSSGDDEEETSAAEQAREFLVELLKEGPVLSDDVQKAAKQAGVSARTLRRAKPSAGVKSRRRQDDTIPSREWPWEWYLPEDPSERDHP